MHIEIVTHCWQFSRLLRYQLASFVWYQPTKGNRLTVTVCYSPDDQPTEWLLKEYRKVGDNRIEFNWHAMAAADLCNRAIGRNQRAMRTKADWVWFADADYCVGTGFFDRLAMVLSGQKEHLVFPGKVLACPHDIGRELLNRPMRSIMESIPVEHFVDHFFKVAIGGVQFVRGDFCRNRGYCNGDERTLKPSPEGWLREISDSRFRRTVGSSARIECDGLYRIRHEEDCVGARKKDGDGNPT